MLYGARIWNEPRFGRVINVVIKSLHYNLALCFLAQVAKLRSVNWLHLTRTDAKGKSTQMTTNYYLAEKTTESPLEETSTFPPQTKLNTSPVPLYENETTELTSQSTSDVSVSKQMLTSTGKTNI